jgi:dihydroorotate dehydrogenase electron transfer subunit
MKKQIESLRVIENRTLNREFFVLKLESEQQLPEIMPGQFVEAKIEGSTSTFLRRPFSIYDVDYQKNQLNLLIKKAGDGTTHLANIEKDKYLNIIYPLGNFFSKPPSDRVLLIGGGTGVAPLLFLGKYFKSQLGIIPEFLLGYRTKDLIIEYDKFADMGEVHITTEDGSFGHKGFVIHHPILSKENKHIDKIYTCGPEIMMKALAKYAFENNVECEASLENLMGCGIGACLCCVVDTIDSGNVNTCTDGPIFNTKKLKWLN